MPYNGFGLCVGGLLKPIPKAFGSLPTPTFINCSNLPAFRQVFLFVPTFPWDPPTKAKPVLGVVSCLKFNG